LSCKQAGKLKKAGLKSIERKHFIKKNGVKLPDCKVMINPDADVPEYFKQCAAFRAVSNANQRRTAPQSD
jgi:hypothetical protein